MIIFFLISNIVMIIIDNNLNTRASMKVKPGIKSDIAEAKVGEL